MTTLNGLIEELRRRSDGFAHRGDTIFNGYILAVELQGWAAKFAALSPPGPTARVEKIMRSIQQWNADEDTYSPIRNNEDRDLIITALRSMPLQDGAALNIHKQGAEP